jgi:hypothetical protein
MLMRTKANARQMKVDVRMNARACAKASRTAVAINQQRPVS